MSLQRPFIMIAVKSFVSIQNMNASSYVLRKHNEHYLVIVVLSTLVEIIPLCFVDSTCSLERPNFTDVVSLIDLKRFQSLITYSKAPLSTKTTDVFLLFGNTYTQCYVYSPFNSEAP